MDKLDEHKLVHTVEHKLDEHKLNTSWSNTRLEEHKLDDNNGTQT